jgi:hypothetical protein
LPHIFGFVALAAGELCRIAGVRFVYFVTVCFCSFRSTKRFSIALLRASTFSAKEVVAHINDITAIHIASIVLPPIESSIPQHYSESAPAINAEMGEVPLGYMGLKDTACSR